MKYQIDSSMLKYLFFFKDRIFNLPFVQFYTIYGGISGRKIFLLKAKLVLRNDVHKGKEKCVLICN